MEPATPRINDIAQVCHAANREYCRLIGDDPQAHWDAASDEVRNSACRGVAFKLDNPDVTPEQQHEAWCADKIEAGWKYGAFKYEQTKEHHCLVPYDELPPEQKLKDYIFTSIVAAFAPFMAEQQEAADAVSSETEAEAATQAGQVDHARGNAD
jgi:hypothetical protein